MTSNSTLDHAAPSFLVAFVTRQLHQTSAGLRATLATSGITPPAYTCQQTPTNRSTTSPGTAHHAASLNSQPASLNSPTPINKSFSSHDISTSPTNNRLVSQPTTTVQRQAHKPLKIININFQSIKNKIAELGNFISVSDPDILIGTETWLKGKRGSRFFFPDDFESSPYPLRRYITQALT